MTTKIISIEGNIGAGKTTLIRTLKERYKDNDKVVFLEEPLNRWNDFTDDYGETILSKFYEDQEEYAFKFQVMAFVTRCDMLKRAIKEHEGKTIIVERCLESDKEIFCKMLYDLGKMSKMEYDLYNELFKLNDIKVDELIYLNTTPEEAYKRTLKRNRPGEVIEKNYFRLLDTYQKAMIKETKIKKVRELDGLAPPIELADNNFLL